MNHKEIENQNRPITNKEIELIIKNLPTKAQVSLENSTKQRKIKPILLKFLQKIEEEGTLLNSFYEASIILIPNLGKVIIRKKIRGDIPDEHRSKNPQQSSKLNSTLH